MTIEEIWENVCEAFNYAFDEEHKKLENEIYQLNEHLNNFLANVKENFIKRMEEVKKQNKEKMVYQLIDSLFF